MVSNFCRIAKQSVVTHLELIVIPEDKQSSIQNTPEEKWIALTNDRSIWLRVSLGGEQDPITHLNLYRILMDKSRQKMKIPRSQNLEPLPIRNLGKKPICKKKLRKDKEGVEINYHYGNFNLSPFLEPNADSESDQVLCICF